MDLGLNGKVAVITGGSEGIGRAAALSLAREGARVVICARRAEVLERAAFEIAESTGAEVEPVITDVTRAADAEAAIRVAVERFGRLDMLVNNAGQSQAAMFEQVDDAIWQGDLDLKVFGAIRMTRAALPHLRAAGGGSIVNVLTIGAKQPAAGSMPSSVSRAAGLAMVKALSKELAKDQIRVNSVLVGLIKSGQHERTHARRGGEETLEAFYARMASQAAIPLGRVGEAAEVGDLIAYLCSPRGAYLTGVAINVDGGMSAVV
jgi:NAD(P)-dependent dehydrogenase (short-subunit alcohol dehydrogenase family)